MAKKSSIKVRLVPESKPDSRHFYYAKKPTAGDKAKDKLKMIFTPSFLYKLKNPYKSRLNLSGSKKYFLSKMLLKTSW